MCGKCGDALYPDAKIEGGITVTEGTCPMCKTKKVTLIPTRDFETENKGINWD